MCQIVHTRPAIRRRERAARRVTSRGYGRAPAPAAGARLSPSRDGEALEAQSVWWQVARGTSRPERERPIGGVQEVAVVELTQQARALHGVAQPSEASRRFNLTRVPSPRPVSGRHPEAPAAWLPTHGSLASRRDYRRPRASATATISTLMTYFTQKNVRSHTVLKTAGQRTQGMPLLRSALPRAVPAQQSCAAELRLVLSRN